MSAVGSRIAGFGVEVLDEQWIEAFLLDRGRERRGDAATCRELLSYLREREPNPRSPFRSEHRRSVGADRAGV